MFLRHIPFTYGRLWTTWYSIESGTLMAQRISNTTTATSPTNIISREEAELFVLNPSGVGHINLEKKAQRYPAGQNIFDQGHASLGVYFVLEGTVGVRRSDHLGNSTLLRLVEAGQTIGHEAYFSGADHSFSATTLTPCRIYFVERRLMDEIKASRPALAEQFLQRMASDIQGADSSRVDVIHLQVRARLVQLLLSLRRHHGRVDDSGNLRITLPMSRRDMASAIGTRPESLSRAIRALEISGTASFQGKQVTVQDLDDLLDEVEQSDKK